MKKKVKPTLFSALERFQYFLFHPTLASSFVEKVVFAKYCLMDDCEAGVN